MSNFTDKGSTVEFNDCDALLHNPIDVWLKVSSSRSFRAGRILLCKLSFDFDGRIRSPWECLPCPCRLSSCRWTQRTQPRKRGSGPKECPRLRKPPSRPQSPVSPPSPADEPAADAGREVCEEAPEHQTQLRGRSPWSKVLQDVAVAMQTGFVADRVPTTKFSRWDMKFYNREEALAILNLGTQTSSIFDCSSKGVISISTRCKPFARNMHSALIRGDHREVASSWPTTDRPDLRRRRLPRTQPAGRPRRRQESRPNRENSAGTVQCKPTRQFGQAAADDDDEEDESMPGRSNRLPRIAETCGDDDPPESSRCLDGLEGDLTGPSRSQAELLDDGSNT